MIADVPNRGGGDRNRRRSNFPSDDDDRHAERDVEVLKDVSLGGEEFAEDAVECGDRNVVFRLWLDPGNAHYRAAAEDRGEEGEVRVGRAFD